MPLEQVKFGRATEVVIGGTPISPALPCALEKEPILRIDAISKSFDKATVISEASLSVHPGEIFTLLGPSGCGKTTMLRIAMGLERCSSGRVSVAGKLVDSPSERHFVPPEQRDIGMVFQSYAIWPHLNVFENVAYPLRVRRTPKQQLNERVVNALSLVGLSDFADRSCTTLSGGQQQRVAIARALVFEPKMILMDEPFSNLDAALRAQLRRDLKQLQKKLGFSVLFVTHDQTEALALSDRIGIMEAGRLLQVGSPTQLYADPKTPSARDFVGNSIVFGGRIQSRGQLTGNVVVELDDGALCIVAGKDNASFLSTGSRCSVSIRPENVRVDPGTVTIGNNPPVENELIGEVVALIFMGNCFEATIRLATGTVISIELPASQTLKEGSAIRLALPPSQLSLWPLERQ